MQACCNLYLQAIEMLEDEGRGPSALDAFRQAIGLSAAAYADFQPMTGQAADSLGP